MADLPSFRHPPLTEAVLSIQFATLVAFQSVHAGLLWSELRNTYPRASEQAPLVSMFETFGGVPAPHTLMVPQIQAFLSPPTPRFWFEAADGEHLLQIQQDRIIHNWRKRDESRQYPRYEEVRRRLHANVARFGDFLQREGLGTLNPNQCEVTYVNIIDLPDGSDPHQHLEAVTPQWSAWSNKPGLGQLEATTIQMRFVLHARGRPVGRIYANFTPSFPQSDQRPVLHLEVTARGKPEAETVPAAFEFLDMAHEAVVRTFAAVTTPELHKVWERTDA
ncbi:MAG: TIGR04255 family protein [Pseudomonadota bacterium]|nr:TIGR04255 family protein [Pseudomonadota bacterium]